MAKLVPCHLFVNPGLRSGEVPVKDKEVRREVALMGAGGEDLSFSLSEHKGQHGVVAARCDAEHMHHLACLHKDVHI